MPTEAADMDANCLRPRKMPRPELIALSALLLSIVVFKELFLPLFHLLLLFHFLPYPDLHLVSKFT